MKDFILRIFNCWIKKKKNPVLGLVIGTVDTEELGFFLPGYGQKNPSCGSLHYCSKLSLLLSVRGFYFSVCDHVTCSNSCGTRVCSYLLMPGLFLWLGLENGTAIDMICNTFKRNSRSIVCSLQLSCS